MLRLIPLTLILTNCVPMSQVVQERRESEVWLHWCKNDKVWDVNTQTIPGCSPENAHRGEWDHIPINVRAEPAFVQDTLSAIAYYNDAVGFELLVYDVTKDVDVQIFSMGMSKGETLAQAVYMYDNGRKTGAIPVWQPGLVTGVVIAHELGHILGLRHSHESRLHLMHPYPDLRGLPRLRDIAVQALRSRYHGIAQ